MDDLKQKEPLASTSSFPAVYGETASARPGARVRLAESDCDEIWPAWPSEIVTKSPLPSRGSLDLGAKAGCGGPEPTVSGLRLGGRLTGY
jgi:hypothetical protein